MNWSVSGIGHDAQSECVHRDEVGKLETIINDCNDNVKNYYYIISHKQSLTEINVMLLDFK